MGASHKARKPNVGRTRGDESNGDKAEKARRLRQDAWQQRFFASLRALVRWFLVIWSALSQLFAPKAVENPLSRAESMECLPCSLPLRDLYRSPSNSVSSRTSQSSMSSQDSQPLFSRRATVAFAGRDAAWMLDLLFPVRQAEESFCVAIVGEALLTITPSFGEEYHLMCLPADSDISPQRVMCAASTVAIFTDRDPLKAAECRPPSSLYIVAHIADAVPTSTHDAEVARAKCTGDLLPLMYRACWLQQPFPILKSPTEREVHVFLSKSVENSLVAQYIHLAIQRELARTDGNLGVLIAESWSAEVEDTVRFTPRGTFEVLAPQRPLAAVSAINVSWRVHVEADWSADSSSIPDLAYVVEFTMTDIANDENAEANLREQLSWEKGISLARRGRAACKTLSIIADGPGGQRLRAHTALQEHNIGESGAPVGIRISPEGLVQIQFWPGQIDG